jgi:hypothetical protein
MPDAPPVGQRFSHVYMQRGEPAQDNKRMRQRLAYLVWDFADLDVEFGIFVPSELGIDIPYSGGIVDWRVLLRDCALQDVLDFVTVAYRYLERKKRTGIKEWEAPNRWCDEVQRIFQEENVHYRVDDAGGVHFGFDAEFESNRAATIAVLQGARYRAALTAFEAGMAALAKAPPDGKGAVRSTFAAAEGLFRLMFPNSPRLTAQEAQQKLEPVLQRLHASDVVALGAAGKLLNAFRDWIDARIFIGTRQVERNPCNRHSHLQYN